MENDDSIREIQITSDIHIMAQLTNPEYIMQNQSDLQMLLEDYLDNPETQITKEIMTKANKDVANIVLAHKVTQN